MRSAPIDVVTIAREYGAGGSDLAVAIGARLGWPVLDAEMVHRVAQRLRLDERVVERLDEHPPSWVSRVAAALLISAPESPVSLETRGVLSPDAVAEAAHLTLTDAARTPPVIIVGHGGAFLLAGRPGTLHLRLVAPLEERARRVAARTAYDAGAAVAEARRMDEERARYVARYFRADWRDPLLYDIVVNTGRLSIAATAALVARHISAVSDAGGVGGAGA